MSTELAAARDSGSPARTDLVASVIVPVRDGWDDLEGLLAALARQSVPRKRFEVIVADDGSQEPIPARLASEDGWLRVTSGPPTGSYAARNRATELARSSVLAFCDADCRPEPDWLRAGLAALEEADVVGGRIRFTAPARPTVWTLLDIETYLDQESAVRVGKAVTANLFIRRELLDDVGGFDTSLPSGGDMATVRACVARGARLRFSPDAVVSHPTRDRAKPFFRKMWRTGHASAKRKGRAGIRPDAVRLRSLVPLAGPIRARLRAGQPFRLDRDRFAGHGVTVSFWDDVRALPLLYLVVPYVRLAARFYGWLDARRGR